MRAALLVLSALCGGCTNYAPVKDDLQRLALPEEPVELRDTAFFPQQVHQCGPAALATVLQASGIEVEPAALIPQIYIPQRRGSLQIEITATARRYGRLPYQLHTDPGQLWAELRAGRPVLVFQNLGVSLIPIWHYAVLIGYLPNSNEVILRTGTTERRVQDAGQFLKSWTRGGRWALIMLRPGEMPAQPDRDRYLAAAAELDAVIAADVAADLFRAAVAEWPDNKLALLGLGNALYRSGKLAAAADQYRQLLALDGGHLIGLNNLASVLIEQGCYKQADILLSKAFAIGIPPGLLPMLTETRAQLDASRADSASNSSCPISDTRN